MTVCGQCPSGFVDNDRDCYDESADVHPGQTAFFEEGFGGGNNYDYDCNGTAEEKNPTWSLEQCACTAGMCMPLIVATRVVCGQRVTQCSGGVCGSGACYVAMGDRQACH